MEKKFKASLTYIVSLRLAVATEQDPVTFFFSLNFEGDFQQVIKKIAIEYTSTGDSAIYNWALWEQAID